MPVVGLDDFGHRDDPPRHAQEQKSAGSAKGSSPLGLRRRLAGAVKRTCQVHGGDCESNCDQLSDECSTVDVVPGTTNGGCHQARTPEHHIDGQLYCGDLQGGQDGRKERPIHVDGEGPVAGGGNPPEHRKKGTRGWSQHWEDLFRALGGNFQEAVGENRRESTATNRIDETRPRGSIAGGTTACVTPLVSGDAEPLSPQWPVQHENQSVDGRETGRSNGDATAIFWQALRGHLLHGMTLARLCRNPNWHLHVKLVGRINRFFAEKYIHPDFLGMWSEAWDIIEMATDRLREEAREHQSIVKRSRVEASLEREDVRILLEFGIIELTSEEDVLGTVRVFVTPEASKFRYRLITEPHTNALDGSKPQEPMQDLCGMKQLFDTEDDGGIQDDFPWFYGQFEMSPPARAWYCFTHEGQYYRLVTVPTGGRAEPNMAHALTASLMRYAVNEANGNEMPPPVKGKAFLDNVCFTGERSRASSAMRTFRRVSVEAGVTISPDVPQWCQRYVFLGVQIDHCMKTVALSEKTMTKLQTIAEALECGSDDTTLRELLGYLGLWVWCATILGAIKASWYALLKFIRRRVNTIALDERVNWWRSALTTAKATTSSLLENRPRQCNVPEQCITVFTDSSLEGWGVVILRQSSIEVHAGRWKGEENIAVLEARALLRALRTLPAAGRRCLLRLMVDNTTVVGSVRRTRCANFTINAIVREICVLAEEKDYVLNIEYVQSLDNIADEPSRCGLTAKWLLSLDDQSCATEHDFFNMPFKSAQKERNEMTIAQFGSFPRRSVSSFQPLSPLSGGWDPSLIEKANTELGQAQATNLGCGTRPLHFAATWRHMTPPCGGRDFTTGNPPGEGLKVNDGQQPLHLRDIEVHLSGGGRSDPQLPRDSSHTPPTCSASRVVLSGVSYRRSHSKGRLSERPTIRDIIASRGNAVIAAPGKN